LNVGSELPIYPAGAKYKCQPKAWFSEDIMLEWVAEILTPYVTTVSVHGHNMGNESVIITRAMVYYRFPFNCPFLHKSEIFYTPYVKNLRFM